NLRSLAFSSDNTLLATGADDGVVNVWNASTGSLASAPLQNSSSIADLAFSPSGQRLLTICDNNASLWDLRVSSLQSHQFASADDAGIQKPGSNDHAHFSPDGRRLLVRGNDSVQVWNVDTYRAVTPPLKHPSIVTNAKFGHKGNWVLTASKDGFAR